MDIEAFCLCKAISVDAANQPTLAAIFDKKIGFREPVLIEPFWVAALIRFNKEETGTVHFQVYVRDGAGNVLVENKEIISIARPSEPSTTFFLHCHMPARSSNFGTYHFTIELSGKQLAHTPLYVIPGKI